MARLFQKSSGKTLQHLLSSAPWREIWRFQSFWNIPEESFMNVSYMSYIYLYIYITYIYIYILFRFLFILCFSRIPQKWDLPMKPILPIQYPLMVPSSSIPGLVGAVAGAWLRVSRSAELSRAQPSSADGLTGPKKDPVRRVFDLNGLVDRWQEQLLETNMESRDQYHQYHQYHCVFPVTTPMQLFDVFRLRWGRWMVFYEVHRNFRDHCNTFSGTSWMDGVAGNALSCACTGGNERKSQVFTLFCSTTQRKTWSGWWFGTFFIFPYIGNNHSNWRTHIFQRGWNHQPVPVISSDSCVDEFDHRQTAHLYLCHSGCTAGCRKNHGRGPAGLGRSWASRTWGIDGSVCWKIIAVVHSTVT